MTENNNNSRDRSKNIYQGTSPVIKIEYYEELANLTQMQLKSHVVNINGKDIESILDLSGQCQVITCEKAKELSLEMDSVKPHKRIPRTKGVTLK
ncbi:1010_t:CDS:1, partial [Diversispora eburnea]